MASAVTGYELRRSPAPAEAKTRVRASVGPPEEGRTKRPDRPDLALKQEIALTRDPQTGTVPRERLLVAKAQIDQMLEARATQRLSAGSLSTALWTEKGPSNIGGRLRALMPDPSDATGNSVWVGSVGGGLWKSTNAAGASPTWNKVNDALGNLAVTTLAYNPANTNTMYFGTGEGYGNADAVRGLGIWKSTDHGATWVQLASTNNNATFHYVQRVVVDKNGWVYAATGNGLFRSKDNGANWTGVLLAGQGYSLSDVDVNPTTGAVYASLAMNAVGGGIYRSLSGDLGTFVNLRTLTNTGLPTTNDYTRVEVAIAPSDPTRLYALFCATDNTLFGVYRSSNGGETWQALPEPADVDPDIADTDFTRGQAWYDLAIAVSPTDPNTVFIGGIDLFKTSNGGASWQQTTHWYGGFGLQNVHADQHVIAFAPGSGTRAYFGNDGGFAVTANATATVPTIVHRNSGLNVTQFYSVAMHPTDYTYFLAGAQDNGTQQFGPSGGTTTRDVIGGDGAYCFIDEDQPQYQFGTYVFSNIYRSVNGGMTFPQIVADNNGSFINPMDYDSKANVLYYAYTSPGSPIGATTTTLRRCLNATGPAALAFASLTLPAASGAITHVAVSPNVDNRVYVGTDTGKVLRIDNANGPTPTVVTIYSDAFTNVSISCVAVERSTAVPNPDQHLLITIANYGSTLINVRQTVNGGTSWTAAEGTIPDMPVRWVVFDPTDGKRAMVATELGVWTTDNLTVATPNWQPSNTNLANVRVDMLRLRKADRMVVAATHGRGLFTSNIFNEAPLPVQLSSFTGRSTAQGVALRWQTASELNTRSFEVERAATGQPFVTLTSKPAAGNSSTAKTYSYLDELVGTGTYAYRLHQIDQDGSATYSPVVTVAVKESAASVLRGAYPNPFAHTLTVELGALAQEGATVRLTDLRGRPVYRAVVAPHERTVQLRAPDNLSSGAYILTVRTGSQLAHRQVMLQR
ncbi:T9SS type A sorting domain-containing protein [Hymenobacter elongatus]|uniref:T9SS type A sorting domain-containing protein n=1 Tax=Hymenobacter elongatus TaxID=877208 RepID=UPI0014367DDA|nr:T9SS type A sorting domain-containing protein [Hymenobacter elongatus]